MNPLHSLSLAGDVGNDGTPHVPRITAHGPRITISAEPDCTVYYSIDANDPSPASAEFPRGQLVELGIGDHVVKAIAVRDGTASAMATLAFHYAPKAIALVPESGDFEGHVTFRVTAEHPDVRYSIDGFIPTVGSPQYEDEVTIRQPGRHVVTAAMFDGPRLVGEPVRKIYNVNRMRIPAPVIEPPPGDYECPLRILISGSGDVYYTLDGSDPNALSPVYTGPIVVTMPGGVLVSAKTLESGTHSEIATSWFNVTAQSMVEHEAPKRATAELPTANIEFANTTEEAAKAKAEEVLAWVLAAAEVKERKLAEATHLERDLFDLRDDYSGLMSNVERVRRELGIANSHRRQLEIQAAAHSCEVGDDVERRLTELDSATHRLALQERSVDAQLQEALSLHTEAAAERTQLLQTAKEQREALEGTFLSQKRELAAFGADVLDEVRSLEMVVAEQRHELALLRSTYEALQRQAEPKTPEGPFLPSKRTVELPSVETVIPIPAGSLRRITTVQGDGLQTLRKKHYVDACVVSIGRGLGIRVVGHSAGVHGFVEAIDSILTSE
jgi:hypothetical protein